MKNAVFWDVAPCRSCVNRCFGRKYRLYLQGIRNPRARNQCEQVAGDSVWRCVPPRRRLTQHLNGATSQKTALFMIFRSCSTDRHQHVARIQMKRLGSNSISHYDDGDIDDPWIICHFNKLTQLIAGGFIDSMHLLTESSVCRMPLM
jgi:hypothetical protein